MYILKVFRLGKGNRELINISTSTGFGKQDMKRQVTVTQTDGDYVQFRHLFTEGTEY